MNDQSARLERSLEVLAEADGTWSWRGTIGAWSGSIRGYDSERAAWDAALDWMTTSPGARLREEGST